MSPYRHWLPVENVAEINCPSALPETLLLKEAWQVVQDAGPAQIMKGPIFGDGNAAPVPVGEDHEDTGKATVPVVFLVKGLHYFL